LHIELAHIITIVIQERLFANILNTKRKYQDY